MKNYFSLAREVFPKGFGMMPDAGLKEVNDNGDQAVSA